MLDKKNIIIAFGNKEFNNSLIELKHHFKFDLEAIDNLSDNYPLENYQGIIIHEDALKDSKLKVIMKNDNINKIIFRKSKKMDGIEKIESLVLPVSIDQINNIVLNNIIKKKFKINSALKINDYKLDKNLRKLIKDNLSLELTEKEIELIELLYKKPFTKKKEILSIIWKYSDEADTHTVETHIYRLRKKISDKFADEKFILNNKEGYYL